MCCSPQWKHHFLGVYLGQPRLIILLPCHTLCDSREKCSEIHLGQASDMVPVWAPALNTASTPHQLLSSYPERQPLSPLCAPPVLILVFQAIIPWLQPEFPFRFSVAWPELMSLRIKNEGAGWGVYT